MNIDLIEIVRIAKTFSAEAGWPFFRLHNIKQIDQNTWELIADVETIVVQTRAPKHHQNTVS